VELIVQPGDGSKPLISAVERAEQAIDLVIFRFDLKALEKAIEAAVKRGVAVRALIAHTNSSGDKRLRQLELRMLDAGVTVSRTADELVRYHGKMLIIDRKALHVYGFNYTGLDIRSRSFGLVTGDRQAVQEALRLFECDSQRQKYEPSCDTLIVSPENARDRLASFIADTKKQLMIWDPRISDPQMVRLIRERAKDGVDVRVIGKIARRGSDIKGQKSPVRLHVRAMVSDGVAAFVGSQSLRALELDGRREIGLFVRDHKVVRRIAEVFESDWARTELGQKEARTHKELELERAEQAG
jgi:cardiolipin synthase A/B